MAGWSVGGTIWRPLFSSKGALIFIAAICMSASTTSYAQSGFLSIDCGYSGADYIDSRGLTWTGDYGKYIRTGKYVDLPANRSGEQSLRSFRSFSGRRNKYCYELPTPFNAYLIRVSFYLDKALFQERRPFEFNLFFDATSWFTLRSTDGIQSNFSINEEAIFYPSSNLSSICLQPVNGLPFISSLELRELHNKPYHYSGGKRQYLALLLRYNLVAEDEGTPYVRYPADKFDRIWQPISVRSQPTAALSTPLHNTTSADVYYVPAVVMQNGWIMDPGSGPDGAPVFQLYSDLYPVSMTPADNVFIVIYSRNVHQRDSHHYSINVTVDDATFEDVHFSRNASQLAISNFILSSNAIRIGMKVDRKLDVIPNMKVDRKLDVIPNMNVDKKLDINPTMNAVEIYGQYSYNFSSTEDQQEDAITALKNVANLTDWQGDPCTPVPHDWLSCTTVSEACDFEGVLVEHCPAPKAARFLRSVFSVSALRMSNLTNVGLSFFTHLMGNTSGNIFPHLGEMSITNSGVDSESFHLILKHFVLYVDKLYTLDFSYNAIERIPMDWYYAGQVRSLNLSHNKIAGAMSPFVNIPLEELDLSYNNLSFIPSTWRNMLNNSLTSLDLSHNSFQGEISSLDCLVKANNQTLQEIKVANNTFGGEFSSSLYFSGIPNLSTAIFDGNLIEGTLNLSTWHEGLQRAASNKSSASSVSFQLFSFVNNSIKNIYPNARAFESTIDILNDRYPSFHEKGILLGGNPYCKGAKKYIQRYLCRKTTNQKVSKDPNHHQRYELISIIGGISIFLFSCIASAILWKLWRQVHALGKIQQALAERKVQPPFYQYNDLKLATKDFHKDNKLGHGGYGIVYKAVMIDETRFAVKKLFSSKKLSVIDDLQEFLNEVVLITGIKHRNLVQLKGCCIKDKQRMLVYEYVERGNLAEALWGSKVHGSLDWKQRYDICVGVARGLSYLHDELQPSILHRDIKPENILLDRNFKPKIADFGLARPFSNETSQAYYTANIAGTLGYFSPEYASEGKLSDKADVYSYGILVLEVITGRKCIDHSLDQDEIFLKDWVRKMRTKGLLFEIVQRELRPQCVLAEIIKVINIGLLCVQHSPKSRPSMSQVVTMFLGNEDLNGLLDQDNPSTDIGEILTTINDDYSVMYSKSKIYPMVVS